MMQPNDVHIWQIKWQDHVQNKEYYLALLGDDELARFQGYMNDHKAHAYLVTHGILRIVLGRHLGVNPAHINYHKTDRGKLFLAEEPNLYFNLSYGQAWTIIALTQASAQIGVDIEKLRPVKFVDTVIRAQFSEAECAAFYQIEPDQRLLAFYRGWTRKEAYIKAIGTGLSLPLQSFSVSLDSRPRFITDDKWNLYEFQLADHLGTLAIDTTVDVVIQTY